MKTQPYSRFLLLGCAAKAAYALLKSVCCPMRHCRLKTPVLISYCFSLTFEQRIDQEIYHMVVAQLQQHVVAKNSKISLETSSADGKTLVPVSEMGRITCDMEFRFMLHRHWSLYEVSLNRLAVWLLQFGISIQLVPCEDSFEY